MSSPDQHQRTLDQLWAGNSPFTNFPTGLYPDDRSDLGHGAHPYLMEAVDRLAPRFVVEVGVWKGASTIAMAQRLKANHVDGAAVLAVDTWLGSAEHWSFQNPWHASLNFEFGQPMLMRTFMNNVILSEVSDVVLPLPLDSVNANAVLAKSSLGLIDLLHVDAGHDYKSVISDLELWWPLVRPGGILVGDDYLDTGEWPEVKAAFDDFFSARHLDGFKFGGNKCRIEKPST